MISSKKHLFLIFFIASFSIENNLIAQENNEFTKSEKLSLYYGMGINRFHKLNNISTFNHIAPLFEVGLHYNFFSSKGLSLYSGLEFGTKLKGNSYLNVEDNSNITYYQIPLYIDNTNANYHKFYLEIPLYVRYQIPNTKFSLEAGISYKQWNPSNQHQDYLNSFSEVTLNAGINYQFNKRTSLSLKYSQGITPFYNRPYSLGSENPSLPSKYFNQSLSVGLKYRLLK